MLDARVCEAAVWLTPLFVEDVDVGDKRDTRIPRQVRLLAAMAAQLWRMLAAALANAQAGAYFFFGCGGVEEHPCAVVCTTSEDCSGGGWSTSAFTWRRLIVDTTLPGTPRRQLTLGNEAAVPSCAHSHRVELLQIASARSF